MPATVTIMLTLCGSVCLSWPQGGHRQQLLPRGTWPPAGLTAWPPPDALTPPNFFTDLQNSPKSE